MNVICYSRLWLLLNTIGINARAAATEHEAGWAIHRLAELLDGAQPSVFGERRHEDHGCLHHRGKSGRGAQDGKDAGLAMPALLNCLSEVATRSMLPACPASVATVGGWGD